MSAPDSSKQTIIGAILGSGFPFQTAIAHVVKGVPDCEIRKEEFPWRDGTGADRFLDLVVFKHSLVITIECKKTQKEVLTFLQATKSGTNPEDVTDCHCVHMRPHSMYRWELVCRKWAVTPRSAESSCCVVGTSASGKDQRMVESSPPGVSRACYLHRRVWLEAIFP
jgi:hypothetical protein